LPDFGRLPISWRGGHALDRCRDRGYDPAEVENAIRGGNVTGPRGDGRWEIYACIGGEMTLVVVAVAHDVIVPVTIYGRGIPCS
jgi:hypothetical protein